MADIVEITPDQQLILDVLVLFNGDTAAAGVALEFIGTSKLNYQILVNQLANVQAEPTPTARAIKSVALATDALTIFTPIASES